MGKIDNRSIVPIHEIAVHGMLKESKVREYRLSMPEAFVLQSFMLYAATGKLESLEYDGLVFYEMDYSKFYRYWGFKNTKALKSVMRSLCGYLPKGESTALQPQLIMHVKTGSDNICRAYFAINPNVASITIDWKYIRNTTKYEKLTALIGEGVDIRKLPFQKKTLRQKNAFSSHALAIFERLTLLDGLFSTKPPIDEHHYSNTLAKFQHALNSIHEGRFSKEYKINDDFLKRNVELIPADWKDILLSAKGDWDRIGDLLERAAINYSSWFLPDCEPSNKDWLPRGMAEWLYSEHQQRSLFIACLGGRQFELRERCAERVFETVSLSIRRIAASIEKKEFDGWSFWTRIKSIEDWYTAYANNLCQRESNAAYWLSGGKEEWFTRYIDFLRVLTKDDIKVGNLGTGNNTWQAFLDSARKDHDIEVNLPME